MPGGTMVLQDPVPACLLGVYFLLGEKHNKHNLIHMW